MRYTTTEAVPVDRGGECVRVFVLRSGGLGWVGLRATLENQAGVTLVGESDEVGEALRAIAEQKPDVIFLAGDLEGMPALGLAERVRSVTPESKLIMLADILDQETLLVLGRVPVDAFLTWARVTSSSIRCTLAAVLEGLRVGTPDAVTELVAPASRRGGECRETAELTPPERAVLHGLATGLKEREIAAQEHVSVRTVEDTVARLKGKFGVSSLAALAGRAMESGFGDADTVGHGR